MDWNWLVRNKPRQIGERILDRVLPYNSLAKKHEDGLTIYYFRHFRFPSPTEYLKIGQETFDIALKLRGDLAVDIGAHVGSYSLRLAKNFREVIAFEPNPLTFRVLHKNIMANNALNVYPEQMAVSDSSGTANLRIPEKAIVGTTLAKTHYGQLNYTKTILARTVSLDDYFFNRYFPRKGPKKLDFVKIDAENHELAVLQGMEKLIRIHQPLLSVEIHQKPDTLVSCDCHVCLWLKSRGLDVQLHGRYTPSMQAHWVIAK